MKSSTLAIDVEVYDGEDVASSSLLYDKNARATPGREDAAFTKKSKISMGRKWSLYFSTVPEFEEEAKSNLPAFVLASGVALSLAFGITWMLVRSRTQAVRASADLEGANRELEKANTQLQKSRESLISAREEERSPETGLARRGSLS